MIGLPEMQAHIWACETRLRTPMADSQWMLTKDELQRASRFRDVEARHAFVVAHSWVRKVLSAYTDIPPHLLRFETGAYGKPFIERRRDRQNIEFNLSHSGSIALLAVTAGIPIGIDIERVRPISPEVAAHCLTPSEVAALNGLPGDLRNLSFMRCWTRKEAYLKATGMGLNVPLHDVEVSVHPWEPARLMLVASDVDEAPHWQLFDLHPAAGYCGALAVRERGFSCVEMTGAVAQ
jgi:4'-phosphopantetheinyl transferase